MLFFKKRGIRLFSSRSYPFYKICNFYQKIENEPGRLKKLELVQQQLSDFDSQIDLVKDYYRLSTGLIQPKFLNN